MLFRSASAMDASSGWPSRSAWNYQFYADLEGHPLDASMAEALRALEREVAELGFLGSYPAAPRP